MKQVVPNYRIVEKLISRGKTIVVGVDEVGRGALAGPVVAAAVILPPGTRINGLRDSKLLTPAKRELLDRRIRDRAAACGLGWATPEEIDREGLTWAVRESAKRALTDMAHPYEAVILDGNHNYLKEFCFSEAHVGADALCASVAAASIVAKVARDAYMRQVHSEYPGYDFAAHKGYATARHQLALASGLTPLHRRRFIRALAA